MIKKIVASMAMFALTAGIALAGNGPYILHGQTVTKVGTVVINEYGKTVTTIITDTATGCTQTVVKLFPADHGTPTSYLSPITCPTS